LDLSFAPAVAASETVKSSNQDTRVGIGASELNGQRQL
jgi:hypothetical protein